MKLFYLIVSVLMTCNACKKLGLCDDQELGFSRIENHKDTLKLGGYYYGDFTGSNPENPGIYVFYQNGIYYYNSQKNINDAQTGDIVLNNRNTRLSSKTNWGVYKIEGNNLEIQSWLPTKNCHHVQTQIGVIDNDSTFTITSFSSTDGDDTRTVNAEFKFVPYSPKSDSVVSFIP